MQGRGREGPRTPLADALILDLLAEGLAALLRHSSETPAITHALTLHEVGSARFALPPAPSPKLIKQLNAHVSHLRRDRDKAVASLCSTVEARARYGMARRALFENWAAGRGGAMLEGDGGVALPLARSRRAPSPHPASNALVEEAAENMASPPPHRQGACLRGVVIRVHVLPPHLTSLMVCVWWCRSI